MGIEIERKFLLPQDFKVDENKLIETIEIEQGYLHSDQLQAIRIRTSIHSSYYKRAYITIKNAYGKDGIGVAEYEYEIPYEDAQEMLLTCVRTLSKTRKVISLGNDLYLEVDIFNGRHSGLIIGEVEFNDEDEANNFSMPCEAIKELTYDPRFKNSELVKMTGIAAAELIKEIYK